MGRKLEWIAGLVLAVFGVAMAAATAEIGVRMLHLEPDRFWEPDPLLGSRHIVGKSGWWTQEDREFVVPVRISQQGWRDVERPAEKAAGSLRVLVLGDSFSEAMQVPMEESFPRRLEAELNRLQKRPVEVVNTGISGFGTAGESLLLKRDGAKYRPDVVLLAFFPGNDVMNNSPELEQTLVPVYAADGRLDRVESAKPPREPKGLLSRLLANSKAFQYGRRRLVTGHPDLARRLGLGEEAKVGEGDGKAAIPTGYMVYAPPEGAWVDAWRRTEGLIRDVQTQAQAMGAQLVVAVVSSREEVYPEWWEEARQTYPAMQGKPWDIDAPRQRISGICRNLGIPVLELAPVLRAQRGSEPLHFHRDGHWTSAGHRIAAEAMANFLVKDGLLTKDGGRS